LEFVVLQDLQTLAPRRDWSVCRICYGQTSGLLRTFFALTIFDLFQHLVYGSFPSSSAKGYHGKFQSLHSWQLQALTFHPSLGQLFFLLDTAHFAGNPEAP
jgi:hypothetical protein